jgi:tetratricopeptide (TPR) repeat protein
MARVADSLIKDFLRTSATEENIALAEKALGQALAIERSPLALIAQARICRAKGEHEGALKACNEALGGDSTLTEASMQKAFALVFLGKPKEALATAMDLDLRDADLGNLYWLLGRAYFTLASASTIPRKDVAKYYHNAIHWLQKCVEEDPGHWYVRAHLIGAYALAGRLGEPEAKAAVNEYREKFEAWPLDPTIMKWADHQRFKNDAHDDFRAAIGALLEGLKKARAKGFPSKPQRRVSAQGSIGRDRQRPLSEC